MTIPFLTLPAGSQKTIEFMCSRLWLNDILSFLEFRLLLMTQVSLCSWNFLIFHAVAFSFLSPGTLKMAIPGQSDHSTWGTSRWLIIKLQHFPRWKWRHRGLRLFPLPENLAWWHGWKTLIYGWIEERLNDWKRSERWFKNWLMTVFPDNNGFLDKNCTV